MKLFKGAIGVSNNTYNSRLFVNADLPELEFFYKRVQVSSDKTPECSQIVSHTALTPEDDFLQKNEYKSISDLKEVNQNEVYVTIGTVKDIESEYNWCYRACKKCSYGLKLDGTQFYCKNCDNHYSSFITRYCIQIRVVDETESASFLVFDKEAANFLNISAHDLRQAYIARDDFFIHENSELLSVIGELCEALKDNSVACGDKSADPGMGSPVSSTPSKVGDNTNLEAMSTGEERPAEEFGSPFIDTPRVLCQVTQVESFATKCVVSMAEDGDLSVTKFRKVIKKEKE